MKYLRTLLAFALAAFMSLGASAQEHGTREEAKAMTEQAAAHIKKVGTEQAFKDFSTDKANWTKKDLYVFVIDMKGQIMAHGVNDKLIGKNLIEMKDQNGKLFTKEMVELARTKGSGWVEYEWAHPQTKKVEGKASYVLKLPNFDGFVSVGIYR